MQVFKSYFKVLKKYMGQMIMYTCIFAGIMAAFGQASAKDKNKSYTASACSFEVVDEDNSELSKALIAYLETVGSRVTYMEDHGVSIQDALYYREIDALLTIPEGFQEMVKNGDAEEALEVITIPNSQKSLLFEQQVDSYLNICSTYTKGFDMTQAIEKTEAALAEEIQVTLPDGSDAMVHGRLYNCYNYLGWVLLTVLIVMVSPVLMVYSKKNIRDRIECSSYNFLNFNKELILAVGVTGIAVGGIFVLITAMLSGDEFAGKKAGFAVINLFVYLTVCMAITFLVSKLAPKVEIVNMYSNIIGLGMAFTCGIFVPADLLGEGVVKAAHFLPAYWYSQNVNIVDLSLDADMNKYLAGLGIQILFAAVIFGTGILLDRRNASRREIA